MSDQITRVNYFERQFLRTQDFADEQAYHVAMRRRHNVSHHTWGVVSGLELVVEEGGIFVQPGAAVDGYGRELILPARQQLATSAFVEKGSEELEVWLVYERAESDPPPPGYAGCGPAGALYYRWQETARVRLERPDPDFPDRRAPEGVAAADLSFSPARTPPEDEEWPVYLGRLVRDLTNKQQPYTADQADRPFVGLVGESVAAPSGRAFLQVGAESAEDENRFAVFVKGADADPLPARPQLSVDRAGNLSVDEDASFYGDLTVAGGAIEFEAGAARTLAQPWSVYHVEDATNGTHELRVEMARAAAPAARGNNRVVVGAWFKGPDDQGQEKEEFHPCLIIDDNCTVTVQGNLIVLGQIIEARSRAQAGTSEAARAFITGGLMSGISAASSMLPSSSGGGGGPVPLMRVVSTPASSADALALDLASDPARLEAFAERLKAEHPEAADKLREALSNIVKP
jgi:hypothetical protein